MVVSIIFLLFYLVVIIASIVGVIYFIGKRIKEKKQEKEILERDDY